MLLPQAKEICILGDAGSLCVISPSVNAEHNNLTCTIKAISHGWVTVRCSEGLVSVRAKDLETIAEAKLRGWR